MIKAHKTAVFTDDDGYTKVIYHTTKVVAFNRDMIVLNSGGWYTKTTKDRMNQTAEEHMLDYAVFQFDYEWFVKVGSKVYPFEDKMILKNPPWLSGRGGFLFYNHKNLRLTFRRGGPSPANSTYTY